MSRNQDSQEKAATNNDKNRHREQMNLLFGAGYVSLAVNFANGSLLVFVQRDHVADQTLSTWWAVMVVILALRIAVIRNFYRSCDTHAKRIKTTNIYVGLIAATGTTWGAAGLLLAPAQLLPYQAFTAIVICGTVAGALGALYSHPKAFALFATPAVLPITFHLAYLGGDLRLSLAFMSLLFLTFVLAAARNHHKSLVAALSLSFTNEEMATQLRHEKLTIEQLNVHLSAEIKERDQAQYESRESEARLNDFAQAASDWFWEVGPDLRYTYLSDSFRNFLTGFNPADAIGKTPHEIGWIQTNDAAWHAHVEDLHAPRPFKNFCYSFVDQNDQEHFWDVSGRPLFTEDGVFVGFRGIGRDITESKHNTARLERFIHEQNYHREILEKQATLSVHLAEELALEKAAVESSEERLRTIFETASEGIATFDDKGIIRSFNKAAEGLFGLGAEHAIGQPARTLFPNIRANVDADYFANYVTTGDPNSGHETQGKRSDGTVFPILISISEMNISGRRMFTSLIRDITESKAAEEKIRHMANHDALTGLPSLRLGKDRLDEALAHARHHDKMIGLMFIDLDGFKTVNDTLGHDAGDSVLIETAQRLTECLRKIDTVARIGGDEFLAIISEADNQQSIEIVAKRIISAIGAPFKVRENDGRATIASIGTSIGIATFPKHGPDAEHLIKAADAAMYSVKKTGKNNFTFAPPKQADTA